MYKNNFFEIDRFEVRGIIFSVCVIQGHKEKDLVEYPEIIKKNIVMEIPEKSVNLLSEFIASENDTYNELFTKETLEKMKTFVYE